MFHDYVDINILVNIILLIT